MTDTDKNFKIFNKQFEQNIINSKKKQQYNDNKILDKLNHTNYEQPILNKNLYEIVVGIKNTWFYLFDDILNQKYTWKIFTKENRLFYIGLTLFIIGLIIFLYNYFTDDDNIKQNEKIIEKHYRYKSNNLSNSDNLPKLNKNLLDLPDLPDLPNLPDLPESTKNRIRDFIQNIIYDNNSNNLKPLTLKDIEKLLISSNKNQ